ncbi:hypothetical protein ACGGZK_14580 [Agromyces sp. MMS24-K17]|uniref:hypothetical protein n=1 Tax=Agromyces sp. MMS24-K17 TaxID=3372850 RepID=UPI003754AC33
MPSTAASVSAATVSVSFAWPMAFAAATVEYAASWSEWRPVAWVTAAVASMRSCVAAAFWMVKPVPTRRAPAATAPATTRLRRPIRRRRMPRRVVPPAAEPAAVVSIWLVSGLEELERRMM